MKNIIGRNKEIRALKKLIETDRPRIGLIYGRRRIGKSFLIEHCVREFNSYVFEGIENFSKHEQLNHFIFQLKNFFGDEVEKKVELLHKVSARKTIQRVLITKSEATAELLNRAYFYKIISLNQLCCK